MKTLIRLLLPAFVLMASFNSYSADKVDIWFAPSWKAKPKIAQDITASLSESSGIEMRPRIAKSYPQIFEAFSGDKPCLVFAGSFAQAIIRARGLGNMIIQAVNGKEYYSGVLVYPKGQDPVAILKNSPEKVAYAMGSSSGESSAKAATSGKASIATKSHTATVGAVRSSKAAAGVVKNWWWEANKSKYPQLEMYVIPGVSEQKNPDYVLSVSTEVPVSDVIKLVSAAKEAKEVFAAKEMVDFENSSLDFSLKLMDKGNIDPKSYTW
ncbi:phosphate/phosphite/phosphonate ABC transporter substrate-binding protein [Vibrio marisflavi]|uniref:Phosphate/phosphite/phosphonate ABC transporter substrate-binding protein n=1 Tax=Vibrio marisflavi CECT 7928 TaxID=634439 RepID=A0ABM9A627_9VIBR|nr:phosphate/phosphite/phosphonate ABC transporter substrate-binding protein [Vibrio marisflavi]CAH0540393.1 hypothetical protein VMF7928_02831 [Vibrio marisflavi CECT 7928]